jgi:hypothetical protein
MRKLLLPPVLAAALALAGCSDQSTQAVPKAPEKPPEAISGQTALWRMFQAARTWAPDAQVLRETSIYMTEVPEVRGKAGAWQATFTSATKGRSKLYTYSAIEGEGNLHKGVFGGLEEDYRPSRDTSPFLIAGVKTDTDAALNMALANGGYDYEKENKAAKGQTISFVLEKLPKFANPAWRVIWGQSVGSSSFSVYIDAAMNDFLERLH